VGRLQVDLVVVQQQRDRCVAGADRNPADLVPHHQRKALAEPPFQRQIGHELERSRGDRVQILQPRIQVRREFFAQALRQRLGFAAIAAVDLAESLDLAGDVAIAQRHAHDRRDIARGRQRDQAVEQVAFAFDLADVRIGRVAAGAALLGVADRGGHGPWFRDAAVTQRGFGVAAGVGGEIAARGRIREVEQCRRRRKTLARGRGAGLPDSHEYVDQIDQFVHVVTVGATAGPGTDA
ncbi:hypothetical protein CATMIT_01566, partial [Catenibacterium mitsuokai DSM 15897]